MRAVQWPRHLSIAPHQAWVRLRGQSAAKLATHVDAVCLHAHAHTRVHAVREESAAFVGLMSICAMASAAAAARVTIYNIPLVASCPLRPTSNMNAHAASVLCVMVGADAAASQHVACPDYYFHFNYWSGAQQSERDREDAAPPVRECTFYQQQRPPHIWSQRVLQQPMCKVKQDLYWV